MKKQILAVLFLLASTLLLSSCAVQMVKKTLSPTRGGVIKYQTGWFMDDKNRDKAMGEIKNYCGASKATILSEESTSEFTGRTLGSGQANNSGQWSSESTQEKNNFVYLTFQCGKRGK